MTARIRRQHYDRVDDRLVFTALARLVPDLLVRLAVATEPTAPPEEQRA